MKKQPKRYIVQLYYNTESIDHKSGSMKLLTKCCLLQGAFWGFVCSFIPGLIKFILDVVYGGGVGKEIGVS